MTLETTRNIVAIIIVAGFVLTAAIIGLVPVLGLGKTDVSTQYLQTYSSVYSGVVGTIMGFYFGKSKMG